MDRASGRGARCDIPADPGPTGAAWDGVLARRTVASALADLHPLVTQSRDGLTLVLLGRDARPPHARAERARLTAAFTLPPGAVGVAVGLYDRLVAVESFEDPDALAAAWLDLVTDAAEAWTRERDAIRAHRAPIPGRGRPDDAAPERLLRRASVAVEAGAGVADERAPSPGAHASSRPLPGAGGPADADADAGGVVVPIRGERVEGAARVVDGRVVRLCIHRREPSDPPDGLVP